MKYTPLSYTEHSVLRLTRGTFFYLRKKQAVPVSVAEAPRAALDLPLAFVRDESQLTLVAILSLDPENNVQIGPKGLWMGGYMPAVVRAYPFAMVLKEGQGHVLADLDSDWLSRDQGDPLFDTQGNPSQILNQKIGLLQNLAPNSVRDMPVLQAIEKSGLLVPWEKVSGNLLRVDTEKFDHLPDEEVIELKRQNALAVIFSHLLSLPRINRLKNLGKRKEKMDANIQHTPDLIQDDDIISFD
jgi:hypothetical protein